MWGLISGLKSLKAEGGGSSGVGSGQGEIGEEEFDNWNKFVRWRGGLYDKSLSIRNPKPFAILLYKITYIS